jgi:hypothetical protein
MMSAVSDTHLDVLVLTCLGLTARMGERPQHFLIVMHYQQRVLAVRSSVVAWLCGGDY